MTVELQRSYSISHLVIGHKDNHKKDISTIMLTYGVEV